MSYRTLLLILVLVPTALLGGAAALGVRIPVPQWGRDYVLRFVLDEGQTEIELPPVVGPSDPSRPLVVIDAALDVLVEVGLVKEEDTTEVVQLSSTCYQLLDRLKKEK